VGRPLRRVEDDALLTGRGRFVDDLASPGCLHLAFVRSPHPHARIVAVRTEGAHASAGVRAIYTGEDVAALGTLAVNPLLPDVKIPPRPILARTRVTAVGEAIVAVVAENRLAALDAADLIEVDYEDLPLEANEAFTHRWQSDNVTAAFAAADIVVEQRIAQPRVAAVALEPRSTLASWDPVAGELTVWASSQTPHRVRSDLARILALDPERVHAISADVGGAFGSKASIYPEDVVVAYAARQLGRPVKWVATRGEDLLAATHGRGGALAGELALRADGTVLALRARLEFPLGSWLPFSAVVPAWNAGRILPGPYRIGAVDVAIRGVVDNSVSVGIYRGAGRPEAAYLMERLMDEAARRLGIDPVEIRQRNLLPSGALPHRTPTGQTLDSGDYPQALVRVAALADYRALRAEQQRRRAAGECVGVGVAVYVEPCGQGWESARVRIDPDGTVVAQTGTSPQGQGQRTAFAQIVADALGVAPESVCVQQGDTRTCPAGVGALASRSTAIGGSALLQAAREARARFTGTPGSFAAPLDAHPDLAAGITVAGTAVAATAVAGTAATYGGEPEDADAPACEATVVYQAPGEAWSYGACVATAAVDPDTGVARVEHVSWVDDAGVVVNPLLAEGQLFGGLAQGLGQALLERIVYDASGQLLTGSLLDYALPRAADMPAIALETMATPSPANALGARGVGESGSIGAPAAIANAVLDALAPYSVTHLDMPFTAERIWRAIRGLPQRSDE
jgi:carbon-monoxide dehydrogenase large subunit